MAKASVSNTIAPRASPPGKMALKARMPTGVKGPKTLAPNPSALVETREDSRLHPVDLAVDRRSRVLVLDPAKNAVRIFERKEK